jgi:GTP-binding protein LepA
MINENVNKIRNFSIIAHIDHGKSTLADRILETTGAVPKREMKERILDTLELEQEKGITIKLQTARMNYKYSGGMNSFIGKNLINQVPTSDQFFILNLIDTPGHVDFSYEVSRSLAASEGAVLLVDATQGVQAQTISTVYKAIENNLVLIPVINKIDLPNADIEGTIEQMVATFGFSKDEILTTSGKTGMGVIQLLNTIVEKVPPPKQSVGDLKALIFDSFYDEHKGVVALVKIISGSLKHEDKICFFQTDEEIIPIEIGFLTPNLEKRELLLTGEVGYIATGLKDIKKIHVGDTVTAFPIPNNFTALPGYKKPKPMVFASLYPVDADEFSQFSDALEKLALNDSSLTFQREHSMALGSGFLCGFLGLLHLEITLERLSREFEINLISTVPSVEYQIHLTTSDLSKLPNINSSNIEGKVLKAKSATEFPDPTVIEYIEEPWVKVEIITPEKYIGSIMELNTKHRGIYKDMYYVTEENQIKGQKHVILRYEMPTAEIITNFFDNLKSISQGYASLDYEHIEYRKSDIVKVAILANQELIGPLSFLTHKDYAERRGRDLVDKLKDIIPRQNFKIPIQAAIGGNIIARETIQAYRKDVTAKLYGGDVTRKKKLLEKQKRGKKRLKAFGKVEIPKEAFLAVLKND